MKCVNCVQVSPKAITLQTGKWYYGMSAQVCPPDADCRCVTWRSDNPQIASVNESSGYIYAKSAGIVKIYATATDGSKCRDFVTVTVKSKIPVESVTLNRTSLTLEKGKTATMGVTICPTNATNRNVNWTSSNNGVATVNNGIITAVSNGSARITATAADGSGKSASSLVSVTGDILVTSIELTPSNVSLRIGSSIYPSVTICPTNATKKSVIWRSANSNIASVNPNSGLVYAKAVGVTTIYATACDGSGVCGCCTVRVVPVYVQDITICPESLTLDVGRYACLDAIISPANATNQNVSWVSCDCNIADVDANGRVIGKAAGTTCICAYATDGSGVHGCCEVRCNTPGTNSIGVFHNLSTLSATPAGVETEAPVMAGFQFSKLQNGKYDIRLVSQIKTLDYQSVGYEIYSKFGDDAPILHILSSKVAYSSLFAAGETIHPNDGFEYFVVGIIENIPENAIASFNLKPFAITLEGQCLYGSATFFSCKKAQKIDYVEFEVPAPGLKTIKQCRIRKEMSMDDSAILKNSNGTNVKLNVGETVPLLSPSTISANGRAWYRILYNGMMLYVTADDESFEEVDVFAPQVPTGQDVFANPGAGSNLNIRSIPAEVNGNIIGQFAHGTNLTLTCSTPQNSEWFAVYGKNNNGTYSYGWCSGEYLACYSLNTIKDCYVRTAMTISPSTILKDSSGKSVVLRVNAANSIRLWKSGKLTGGEYSDNEGNIRNDWYMVEYDGQSAYVTADSFNILELGTPLIDDNQGGSHPSGGDSTGMPDHASTNCLEFIIDYEGKDFWSTARDDG